MPVARVLICRMAFIVFCLAPTLGFAGWLALQRLTTPAHAAAAADPLAAAVERLVQLPAEELAARAAAELSQRLGLRAAVERVEYPQPGVTALVGVQLHDPETGQPVAACERVELAFREPARLAIELVRPRVAAGQCARLAEVLHGRLLREVDWSQRRVELWADSLTLGEGAAGLTLVDATATIEPTAAGPAASFRFRPAGQSEPRFALLTVVRQRRSAAVETAIAFDTGETAWPLACFAAEWPAAAEFGDAAFAGRVEWRDDPLGWEQTITGRLSGAPLDRFVDARWRTAPLGSADVVLSPARLRGGRLTQAAGWLIAGPLDASWLLLAGLRDDFQLPAAPALLARLAPHAGGAPASVAIERMVVGFVVDDTGLTLQAADRSQGTIAAGNTGPLLQAPGARLAWTPAVAARWRGLGLPAVDGAPATSIASPLRLRTP